jgi:hypothetical protein
VRLLPVLRGERGTSLAEVAVVVALLGMVLAMAQGMLILTQKQVKDDSSRLDQAQHAKVAVESMTRSLRTAILPKQLSATCTGCDIAAFIKGDERSVEFYANLDNDYTQPTGAPASLTTKGPSRVTYRVQTDGSLLETVQRPLAHAADDYNYSYCDPANVSCEVRRRVVARGVSTTGPLFTYYAQDGQAIAVPLESEESRLKAVDSIDLFLTVKASTRVVSSTVTTRVTLPNADSVIPTATPTPTA